MRAIVQDRYGSADVLEVREVPEPTIAADDDVLVRVRAASLNAADMHIMRGQPAIARLAFGLRRPRIATRGIDFAGVVEAVGASVADWRPGDEVFGGADGSFAPLAKTRAQRIARKPRAASFEEAACLPMAATTALQGLRDHARLAEGQRALVIGASGGVGSFAVQIAKAMGAHVVAATRPERADLVRALGADEVAPHDALGRHAGRFDVVFDVGGERSFGELRALLTPSGVVVSAGAGTRQGWALAARPASAAVAKRVATYVAKESRADLEAVAALVDAGKLKAAIGSAIALDELPDAMRAMEARESRGKTVIRMGPG